jgi:Protein of unknown function (DUF3304)
MTEIRRLVSKATLKRRLCCVGSVALAACQPAAPLGQTTSSAATPQTSESTAEGDLKNLPRSYSVTAYGYNYTDLYIDGFEIDGSGGGNLEVSSPTSGGGGHTCCAIVTPGLPVGTTFNIKWTRDRKRWCQQDVPLNTPVPKDPRYFEVHFYPDGKIEIEVTQRASKPRLKLDGASYARRNESNNVNNDEKFWPLVV